MLWAHMPAQRCVYARAASICWHGEPIDQTLTPDDRRSVLRPLAAHRRCATSRQLSTTYGAALTPPRTKSSTHSPCRERRSSRAEALAGSHVAAHCRACAWQAPSMTCNHATDPFQGKCAPRARVSRPNRWGVASQSVYGWHLSPPPRKAATLPTASPPGIVCDERAGNQGELISRH